MEGHYRGHLPSAESLLEQGALVSEGIRQLVNEAGYQAGFAVPLGEPPMVVIVVVPGHLGVAYISPRV